MVKLIGRLMSRFKLDQHINDEQLIAFIDGELGARKQANIQRHIESCWRCRARRQQMEATVFALVERRQQLLRPFLPLSSYGEGRFIARLDQQIDRERRGWKGFIRARLHRFSIESMNPIVASIVVVALSAGVLFLIWQPSSATLSANDLLRKAQASERAAERAQPGVIYQKIAIRNGSQVLERTLYRDAQKKRAVRAEHLNASAQRMKETLESAGLNWEMPLSAVDYGRWRSAQAHARDDVKQNENGLVTLVTTSSEGAISQESLTLRMSDLHPVNRTIDLRGSDRFEIAELSCAALGWNEVNAELFDASTPKPTTATLRLAALPPTSEQLDDAELGARLVLHNLNADTNEQIQITRSQGAVHISGIIDTIDRKEKLSKELRMVPHVVPSLFSIEELTARRSAAPNVTTVQEYSATAETAPLEKYFRNNSRSEDTLNQVSDSLLNAVLAAQRESSALAELSGRFSASEKLSEPARDALRQLMASHTSGLRSAIDAENEILRTLSLGRGDGAQDSSLPNIASAHLPLYGARNLALCRELISAGNSSSRPAPLIVADMLATTAALNNSLALLAPEQETRK
jgi:hypothetical protein